MNLNMDEFKYGEKIVIVSHEVITAKKEKELYIKEIHNNFVLEYWDIFPIVHKGKNVDYVDKIINKYKYKQINNIDILKNELSDMDLKKTIFLLDIPLNKQTNKIFKTISYYNCITCNLEIYNYNNSSNDIIFMEKNIILYFLNINIVNILIKKFNKNAYERIYNTNLNMKDKYIKYSFCCSLKGKNNDINREKIRINPFDYDNYLKLKNRYTNLINGKYCVFLDQFMPYHPDFILNTSNPINAKVYFRNLYDFFKLIQKTFNIEVVIAAHPTANYDKRNIFNEFRVIKYSTAELVKDCEFVIAHDSLSINLAVLFDKPIISVFTDEMKKLRKENYKGTISKARMLGNKIYNLDKIKKVQLNKVNISRYNFYKYNYLTHKDIENKCNSKIIINEFNKIFENKRI